MGEFRYKEKSLNGYKEKYIMLLEELQGKFLCTHYKHIDPSVLLNIVIRIIMSLKGLTYFPLYSSNDNVSCNLYKFSILIIASTVFIYLLKSSS